MKTRIKHTLLDLKEKIGNERDEALADVRIAHMNMLVEMREDLQEEQKAIRIAYKEKYAIAKQEVIDNEQQNEQTTESGDN